MQVLCKHQSRVQFSSGALSLPIEEKKSIMKVSDTKLMKEILKDPEARKQLQKALAAGPRIVIINGVEYELVPVSIGK